ncbi:MAG: BlaI/MecI/CopY family transcriptional regulator [Verrucomicrobiae bacterium]|nr:BlaI/MecI/CopY family transcriptional regulator [Verrucomicrobiae bacterium]
MSSSGKVNKDVPKPTEAELELLRILWERGPDTVGAVHKAREGQGTGYTTTLKLLQRMTEKGLVLRDESQHAHVYRAAITAEKTQRQLVRDLLQRAFGGSPLQLVVQALSEKRASAEDLSAIRQLLDEMEQKEDTNRKKTP